MLRFESYRKKIDKNTTLELDFKVDSGEILTIVSNRDEELKILKDSFREKTKFKGDIYFKNISLSKKKLIFPEDYGFYSHLTLGKNLKKLLKIFGIKLSNDDLEAKLNIMELDSNKKYQELADNEKFKFHVLFSVLINQEVLVLDNTKKYLNRHDKECVRGLIVNESNNSNIIIFDKILNRYNAIADNVLVISDGLKSYYGTLEDLLVIKQLAAINVSHQDDLAIVLKDYQYTIYNDEEIVVRESVLEGVVYELLKNGIEVLQIRNLGEKIKLYEGEVR